jgi:glycosyltransferase involved in cell wall biosynthesis
MAKKRTKEKPLFSILIPTYNRSNYVVESVQSVIGQTNQDFEIIISNNASTDNTKKILQKLKEKDKRIEVFNQKKNLGSGGNVEFLLSKPKGKYVVILFDDDKLHEGFLSEVSRIFKENDVDYVYTNSFWIDKNSKVVHKNKKRLYPKGLIEKYGLLKDRYHFGICANAFKNRPNMKLKDKSLAGDYIFALELSLNGTGYYCHKNLFYYRFHSGNESQYGDLFERSVDVFDSLKRIYLSMPSKLKKKMEAGVLNNVYLTFFMSIFYQSIRKFDFKGLRKKYCLLSKKTGFFRIRCLGVLKFIKKLWLLVLSTITRSKYK